MESTGLPLLQAQARVAGTMMVFLHEVDCRGGGRRQPGAVAVLAAVRLIGVALMGGARAFVVAPYVWEDGPTRFSGWPSHT